MFVDIIIIICFVLLLVAGVGFCVLQSKWSNKVWSVTVDGVEYSPVTALDFEKERNEVSFVHLEENRIYRLAYVEVKYVELVPSDEKSGNVAVFENEEQANEDR